MNNRKRTRGRKFSMKNINVRKRKLKPNPPTKRQLETGVQPNNKYMVEPKVDFTDKDRKVVQHSAVRHLVSVCPRTGKKVYAKEGRAKIKSVRVIPKNTMFKVKERTVKHPY